VPWDAGTLAPLFRQLIPTVEKAMVSSVIGKCEKAGFPGVVIEKLEKDAAWPEAAKQALAIAGPQVTAKWMNKTGISAENQPEVVLVTALATLAANHFTLMSRLNKLIAAQPAAAAAAPKKP
jgi:hypothetical protein